MTTQDAQKRPKRGHGEGTVTQHPDGKRYVGRIMLGYKPNGRPDRPKVIGQTKAEVQRKLAELKRNADQGMRGDPAKERQAVAAFLDTWLATASMSTRTRTHERYSQVVRLHLAPTIGRQKLSTLRPDAI